MQQLGLPGGAPVFDADRPPEIRPSLPELAFDDEDVIEGLEFRDAIPPTDTSVTLNLSLEDPRRPLPEQVGKWLSDTLGSIFRASGLGYFETSSAGSRMDANGRRVPTDIGFSVGIKGDPQRAVQLVRETLWWVGAPADTDLEPFPLALSKTPETTASRFLQLVAPKITRWHFRGEAGHRIDRLPFSTAQREGIRRILAEFGAAEPAEGWTEVATRDGGRLAVSVKYLDDSADFNTLNILVEVLTPEISRFIHRLMRECALMLSPMALAASSKVARTIDCDWPKVEVVRSAAALHEVLARGPYHWWRRGRKRPS
jgi:hypothetical protein